MLSMTAAAGGSVPGQMDRNVHAGRQSRASYMWRVVSRGNGAVTQNQCLCGDISTAGMAGSLEFS